MREYAEINDLTETQPKSVASIQRDLKRAAEWLENTEQNVAFLEGQLIQAKAERQRARDFQLLMIHEKNRYIYEASH